MLLNPLYLYGYGSYGITVDPNFRGSILLAGQAIVVLVYLNTSIKSRLESLSPFEIQLKDYVERKIIHFEKSDGTPREGIVLTNNENKNTLFVNNINNWQTSE